MWLLTLTGWDASFQPRVAWFKCFFTIWVTILLIYSDINHRWRQIKEQLQTSGWMIQSLKSWHHHSRNNMAWLIFFSIMGSNEKYIMQSRLGSKLIWSLFKLEQSSCPINGGTRGHLVRILIVLLQSLHQRCNHHICCLIWNKSSKINYFFIFYFYK
jgi:hypothetical protein